MDIHIQSFNTDLYKRSVINMGTKLYNILPGYIKEIDRYKTFKKELKSLLLYLCLYNQLFALFYYVFKFLTP